MRIPLVPTLALSTLFVAVLPILGVWKVKAKGKLDWMLSAAIWTALMAFAIFAGAWGFLSAYARFLFPTIFVFALATRIPGIGQLPLLATADTVGRIKTALKAGLLVAVMLLDGVAIRGHFSPGEAVELSFPLTNGTYSVLQGGNSPVTNLFHRASPSEKYALDIVKLNAYGNRAKVSPRKRSLTMRSLGTRSPVPATAPSWSCATDWRTKLPARRILSTPRATMW